MLKKRFVAAAVTAASLGLFASAGTAAAGSWPADPTWPAPPDWGSYPAGSSYPADPSWPGHSPFAGWPIERGIHPDALGDGQQHGHIRHGVGRGRIVTVRSAAALAARSTTACGSSR